MSKLILTLLLLTIIGVKAQVPKIHFDYDDFGNQIRRELCANCPLRISNQPQKEISEIKQEDLQKFSSQDVISYYPNPVKEELYLKWDLIKNNTVNQIEIHNFNGQLIEKIDNLDDSNFLTLQFSNYPIGIYFITLNYSNNDQKSIKIIKK